MSLDHSNSVDAIGIENETGHAVLTIADSWEWNDERAHLLALQAKLNAYFEFIESGQIWDSYPTANGRQLIIEVITRFRPTATAIELLEKANETATQLCMQVRHRHFTG
jgi:hypothetical protein